MTLLSLTRRFLHRQSGGNDGFNLIELMVGITLMAIGLLGFAGMLIIQTRGTRIARKIDEAATLVQATIEDMSAICWDELGKDTTMPAPNGLDNAVIRTDGPLNRNGEAEGVGDGPYVFYRHVVICKDTDTGVTTGADPEDCGVNGMTGGVRPAELACDNIPGGISSREKYMRVGVTWVDSMGVCHHKVTDSIHFDWDGPTETCTI
jgi:prepilin-type N-terminal cleavage/methylation domain-containing protein